jgi:hypothetical protein
MGRALKEYKIMAILKSTAIQGDATVTGTLQATTLRGTLGNDYAEMWSGTQELKAGQCCVCNDNGILCITSKRLEPGAVIISDTYGYLQGVVADINCPVAMAGKVLAYPTQDISNYHAGMAVCSAPNGTVDIMTREEIQKYPDCIVGIVVEIPTYETWNDIVKVDGRIWIKVH